MKIDFAARQRAVTLRGGTLEPEVGGTVYLLQWP